MFAIFFGGVARWHLSWRLQYQTAKSAINTEHREPIPRWYRFTPDLFVICVLLVECVLWLWERSQSIALSPLKGLIIPIYTAALCVAFLSILLWFIASLFFHRRFQFSLRSLFVLAIVVAVPCSRVATLMQQARHQREAVAMICSLGGDVHEAQHFPDWWITLHGLFPDVFFEEIRFVEFKSKNNGVSDADLKEIVKLLPHINLLFLAATNVTDAGLETLDGLNELNWLSLSDTKITDSGMERLKGIKQLKMLSLDNTRVTDSGLERLKRHKLSFLRVSGTQVTNAGLRHLEGHTVRSLALGGTSISDGGLQHLAGQKELQSLVLTGTKVTDAGLRHLRGMKELSQLDLSRTMISDTGLECLEGLKKVIMLDLSGTKVTDKGLEHLKALNQLQELKLDGTNVTDAGLEHLKRLRVDTLSLAHTKVTNSGVAKLQRALPDCQITR